MGLFFGKDQLPVHGHFKHPTVRGNQFYLQIRFLF